MIIMMIMNKERSVNVRRHATRAAGGDGRGCSLDTVKEWISSIVSDGVVTVRWLMPAARSGAATDGSHCNKYPYIHRYFVANFPHCNVGPGFTNPSTYGYKRIRNRGSVKIMQKLATKYPWLYGHFLQCSAASRPR